jgi:hypothetical protein
MTPTGCPKSRKPQALHFEHEALAKLIHYDHSIPLGHGFSQRYVDEHLPGWRWGEVIGLVHASDVWLGHCAGPDARGFTTSTVRPTVRALHFTSPTEWLVEWDDGWVSEAPVRIRAQA